MWYELVEWWVEQTDVNMESVHCLEDSVEVCLLVWEEFSERFLTTFNCLRENHFAHCDNLLIVEEHVFCTCQTDTLSSECTCNLCIVWSVGIGTYLQFGVLVAEVHECLEVA